MTTTASTQPPRARRLKRVLAGLVLLLFLLIALVPTLAGRFARGTVARLASDKIPGTIAIDSLSLGWLSGQTIGPLHVRDEQGADVASATIRLDKGLLALLTGGATSADLGDLGTITVSGRASIVRGQDGRTNLERALGIKPADAGPAPAPPAEPRAGKLPRSLRARILIDSLDATYVDRSGDAEERVSASDLRGRCEIETGQDLVLALNGRATRDSSPGAPAGEIAIDAKLGGWSAGDGTLTLGSARVDAKVAITSFPTGLLDAFARGTLPPGVAPHGLAKALGESLELTLTATGNSQDADVSLSLAMDQLNVSAAGKVEGGVLTSAKPLSIRATGEALAGLAPALADALAKGQVNLASYPDVQVLVDDVRVRLPASGSPIDWRGGGATLALDVSPIEGTVRVGPGPDDVPRPFSISQTDVKVLAPDLSRGLKIVARSLATLDGRQAGVLESDITADGLLDADGSLVPGTPRSLNGTIALRGIATAIARPFVASLPIDLPADLGPSLDIEATASTQGEPDGGGLPPTNLSLAARAQNLQVSGELRVESDRIVSRDRGVLVTGSRVASLAGRFLPPESSWKLGPGAGELQARVPEFSVPLDAQRRPRLDSATGRVEVSLGDVSLAGAAGEPVRVEALTLVASLASSLRERGSPHVEIESRLTHEGRPFSIAGTFDVPGAVAADAGGALLVTPLGARPTGRLDVHDLPTSLARLALKPGEPGGLDTPAFVADAIGPTATIALAAQRPGDSSDASAISFLVRAQGLNLDGAAKLSPTSATLEWTEGTLSLTPSAVDRLLAGSQPDAALRPRLAAPAGVWVRVEPISIPLGANFAPQFARAGDALLRLALSQPALLQNLRQEDGAGNIRDLGAVGVKEVSLVAKVPLAGLDTDAPRVEATAEMQGTLINADRGVGTFNLQASSGLHAGKPEGVARAVLSLKDLSLAWVDTLAGKPGVVSGAIGSSLGVDVVANVSPRQGPEGPDFGAAAIDVEASLAADRLKTSGPIRLAVGADRLELRGPAKLAFTAEPAWVQTLLAPAPDAKAKVSKPVSLSKPAEVTIDLESLVLAKGEGVGPLKPGVFSLGGALTLPQAQLRTSDDKLLTIRGVAARVAGGQGPITIRTTIDESGVEGQPAARGLIVQARVEHLADDQGNVDLDAARLFASGDLVGVPTALFDALAQQNGVLVEALGPTSDTKFSIDNAPLGARAGGPSGSLVADFRSPRASASIRGDLGEGVFRAAQPIELSLNEVTAALGGLLVRGLPFVGTIEKKLEDGPALVRIEDLVAPLDHDLSRLNGTIRVSPGAARFATSDVFGKLLKLANLRETGLVGQKLNPLDVTVRDGVMSYPRYKLPLGEFTIETEGSVNLANRTMDVVTYVPAGAVADETIGLFRITNKLGEILGPASPNLDRLVMLPFRTKGSLDGASTSPDLELFAKETIKTINPVNIIEEGAGRLGDIFKKKPQQEPPPK